MRFRDDIDLDRTWVVSDTHFGHENIVGFCHRPEEHDQVMIAEWRKAVPDDATVLHLGDLSYKSNARFKHIVAKELTGERKLLVKGNHDKQNFSFYRDCGFKLARPFALSLAVINGATNGGKLHVIQPEHLGIWAPSFVVSFSHYAWGAPDDGEVRACRACDGEGEVADHPCAPCGGTGRRFNSEMPSNHWRIHGHIHNNGYQRSAYVPFLRNHINMSIEQTGYKPVNLRHLLEGAILGVLPASTEAEADLAEAAKQRSLERRASDA